MDAPPIQYARTEDGVNIAYWTMGTAPPTGAGQNRRTDSERSNEVALCGAMQVGVARE